MSLRFSLDDVVLERLESVQDTEPHLALEDLIEESRFSVSSVEDVLYPLIDEVQVILVVGAYFGDEGKGKTVAAVAQYDDIELIVRDNSGENAGHTVYFRGIRFVFHLAPSGILTGKRNLIGENAMMDPVTFMTDEILGLVEHGIDYSNLGVGNVGIVTPYHKILDALGIKNSSTLKGMSPSHASKARKNQPRLNDLFGPEDRQRRIFEKDMEVYFGLLKQKGLSEADLLEGFEAQNEETPDTIPDHIIEFLKSDDKARFLIGLYQETVVSNEQFPTRTNVKHEIREALKARKKVLLEGPQSYFLSNMVDTFFGSSTSADTTSAGVQAAAGYNTGRYRSVTINVHKAPASSRVGNGANVAGFVPQSFFSDNNINTLDDLKGVCDDFDAIQKQYFDSIGDNGVLQITEYVDRDGAAYPINVAMAIASAKVYGESGATTLKPRVTGLFDCVAHYQVNEAQGPYLSISALDRGDIADKFGLVVAYVVSNPEGVKLDSDGREYHHGEIILPGDPLPCEDVLHYCQPIIKVMDGWKDNPIGVKHRKDDDELPVELSNVLSEIEIRTDSETISIGNGPETENLLYLQKVS